MSWAEPAAQEYHDVGQPVYDGRSRSSGGAVEGTAADMLEGLAGQAASTGPRTGSCCCRCKSAVSSSRQLLYTVPVHPDSSSALSPG